MGMRRIICSTRTSLAAWGQSLFTFTRGKAKGRRQSLALSSNSLWEAASFGAGRDNRLAAGQRWPLALLSGLSDAPEMQKVSYFLGAAFAASVVTIPVQLLLGAALQSWSRNFLYVAIALA